MGHITHKNFWIEDGGNFLPLNPLLITMIQEVKRPVYREDTGVALATRAEIVKSGKRIGKMSKLFHMNLIQTLLISILNLIYP